LRRKLSLPVIYTLAREPIDGALHQLYQLPAGDDAGIHAARDAMTAYGAHEAVAAMAQAHYVQASAALRQISAPNASIQQELQALADSLLGRRV
jgi:geranylgeranyl pyrophosphate synthase